MLLTLPIVILLIVAEWKILTKANEAGWKVLIPIYGQYVFYKIAGATKYFWRSIMAVVISSVLAMIGVACAATGEDATAIVAIIISLCSLGLSIYSIYCQIRYCSLLSKSFGKGGGFAAGLFLLGAIFYPILGFSSDICYQGSAPARQEPVYEQFTQGPATVYTDSPTVTRSDAAVLSPAFHSAQLVGMAGIMVGRTLPITATSIIGRSSSADIQLNDTTVSGRHCQIGWRGDSLFITDLGSSNGTSVEGYGLIPANVPVELRNKDIIRISRGNVFEVQI